VAEDIDSFQGAGVHSRSSLSPPLPQIQRAADGGSVELAKDPRAPQVAL
jgi:hypothetical protein